MPHLNPGQQARFDKLMGKRQNETISPDELQELIQITDAVELRDEERAIAAEAGFRLGRF